MSDDLETFLANQFPFRPTHPDFARLREIVDQVEKWRADGVPAEQAYADIVDVISASYLGANRAYATLPPDVAGPKVAIAEAMTNAWIDGLLFGVLFERAGGHRADDPGE